jgi:O-methyltransferase
VGYRKKIADFLIKDCGLSRIQDTKLQRFMRAFLDEIDLQHFRVSRPGAKFSDRSLMWKFIEEKYLKHEAVDYVEFGVFEGESIRHWTAVNKDKESRFIGFDSFEGLPADWHAEKKKGHFDVQGRVPQINDPRVKFIKGWFDSTIPDFARDFSPKNHLVMHIDCDLYAGAMLALIHFTPFMSKGTILIFDEFIDREHEFRAFMDWEKIYQKNFQVIAEADTYVQVCIEIL